MSLYECSGCGVIVSSNGNPDECPACHGTQVTTHNEWDRIDGVDELLS